MPFDLAFIAIIQLAALGYGLHAAFNGRPVFQVFVVDRIELISAAEVDAEELKLADPKFANIGFSGSTLVAATLPSDPKARAELALSAAAGIDVKHFLRYYADYTSQKQAIIAVSKPLAELEKFNDPAQASVAQWTSLQSVLASRSSRCVICRFRASGKTWSMVIDSADASSLGLLRLRPWQE